MTNANDPINANSFDPQIHAKNGISSERISEINSGLTKREYFAAMAMQGLLANPNTAGQIRSSFGSTDADKSNQIIANTSCKLADALINALNETK